MASSMGPNEVKWVSKYLDESGDKTLFCSCVRQIKGAKEQDRILLVGKYRVLTIKTNKLRRNCSCSKSLPILSLRRMIVDEAVDTLLTLVFADMELVLRSPRVPDAVQAIRTAFAAIGGRFPLEHHPVFVGPPSTLLPISPTSGGAAAAFLRTYRAYCDLHGATARTELECHVRDQMADGLRDLDLNECFENCANPPFGPADVRALCSTLKFDTWFRNLIAESLGLTPEGSVVVMGELLRVNTSIATLSLCAAGLARSSFTAFAESLSRNRRCAITELDLSMNHISLAMAADLGQALASSEQGLHSLTLSHCDMVPRASATVLRDMAGLSGTLRVMNLSRNNLGRDGSAALAEWLSGSFALTHLILSDASVDVSQVTQALLRNKVLSCSSLALLDLSRNKICANGCAYLGNVMHATTSLTCLVLVAMPGLGSKKSIEQILEPALSNPNPAFCFSLDLSQNDLSGRRGVRLAELLRQGSAACLSALLLNRCNLGGDKMSQVCDAIGSGGRGIELLALDCNIRTGLFSTGEGAVAKLAGLVCTAADTRAGLKALYLRGTKACCIKQEILPLLKTLSSPGCSLVSLNITGQYAGDQCGIVLGDVMAHNQSLRSLRFDRQNMGIAGFQGFYDGLEGNTHLIDLEASLVDVKRIFAQKNRARSRLLRELIEQIDGIILRNQGHLACGSTSTARRSRRLHSSPSSRQRKGTQEGAHEEKGGDGLDGGDDASVDFASGGGGGGGGGGDGDGDGLTTTISDVGRGLDDVLGSLEEASYHEQGSTVDVCSEVRPANSSPAVNGAQELEDSRADRNRVDEGSDTKQDTIDDDDDGDDVSRIAADAAAMHNLRNSSFSLAQKRRTIRRKHSSSSLLHELNSSEWGSGHQSPPERPLPSDVVGVSPVAEAVEEPNGPQPVPSTRSDPCLASGFASSALEPPVRAHSDHRSLHVPIPVIPPPPTKPQHLPASGLHVPAPIARVPPPPIPRAPPKARSRPPVIINGQAPATGTRPQSIGFAVPPRPGRSAPPFAPPPPHAERSVSSNDAVAPWRSFNDIVQRRESAEACVRRRASQDSQDKREKRPFE